MSDKKKETSETTSDLPPESQPLSEEEQAVFDSKNAQAQEKEREREREREREKKKKKKT